VSTALAVFGVALGGIVGCAPHLEPIEAPGLCQVLEQEVDGQETPSLIIAAFARDRTLFLDARGIADPIAGQAATPESVYMFFSITKVFTATAVMTLVDEGRLDLDQPIDRYLSDLALVNPFETALTARHLLNHSSGLPNPPVWSWAHPHDQARPDQRQLLDRALAEHGRLEAEPGTRDEYNNLGYLILGRLVEDISGEPYEDYVRSRILEPLEMEHTDFVYRPDMVERAAIGGVKRNSIYHRLFRRVAPNTLFGPVVDDYATARLYLVDGASYAGLVGTAPDLAKFASMHLAGGTWHGARILSQASVEAMQEIQYTKRGRRLDHALGWHTDEIDGERYFNHMGRGGGFRPAVRIYPGLGYGVVVLSNRTNYDPRPITTRVPIEGAFPGPCPG
jgi:CubicO group peptidase (beta-lactamase class C family)